MKSIYRFFLVLAAVIGFIYGGCGSCSVSKNDAAIPIGKFYNKSKLGWHSRWSSTCFLWNVQLRNKRQNL